MTKTTGSIAASTNIVKESVVMGDVSIGADSTILFYAVLRGDDNKIIIGKGTNIQDNCTVHTSKVDPTIVGDYVTVGHNAVIHGCTIGDNTLIGMGATVMNGSVIGKTVSSQQEALCSNIRISRMEAWLWADRRRSRGH